MDLGLDLRKNQKYLFMLRFQLVGCLIFVFEDKWVVTSLPSFNNSLACWGT